MKTAQEWREDIAGEQYHMPYAQLEPVEQIQVAFRDVGLMRGRMNDQLLLGIIAGGSIAFIIKVLWYAAFVLRLRSRRIAVGRQERDQLVRLCAGKTAPRMYRNTTVATPMLVGAIRPVIYLPVTPYTPVQLQSILLHELAHLRRRDVLVKWLAAFAVHLHWFNPVAYLVSREIDRACELACDEAVIKGMDTSAKQAYGETLLTVAAEGSRPSHRLMSLTMCQEKKMLKERLGAIMRYKKASVWGIGAACLLIAAGLWGAVMLGAEHIDKATPPVVTLYAGGQPIVADIQTGVAQLPPDSLAVQAVYRDNTGKSSIKIYRSPAEEETDPRMLGGAARRTGTASQVQNTAAWDVAQTHPQGYEGYVWAVVTDEDGREYAGAKIPVRYLPR